MYEACGGVDSGAVVVAVAPFTERTAVRVWVSDGDPGQVLRVQYGYDDVPDRVWEIGGPDSMYPVTNDTPDWRVRWRELDLTIVKATGMPAAACLDRAHRLAQAALNAVTGGIAADKLRAAELYVRMAEVQAGLTASGGGA